MEDLNKQQLVLLVLLVSFVTSIATGIITVSLLSKAPVEVRQTINRVVERTVETVVPDSIQSEDKVVTVRETVVVTEEDRVVDAISKNKSSIVRIVDAGGVFVAIGVVKTKEGEVLTVNGDYSQVVSYKAVFDTGEEVDIKFTRRDDKTGAVYFKLITEEGKSFSNSSFSSNSLQLGQNIVIVGGDDRNIISTGFVSDLPTEGQIITNIDISLMSPGSVLLNLTGEVVGLLSRQKVFISAKTLLVLEAIDTSNTASAAQSVQ